MLNVYALVIMVTKLSVLVPNSHTYMHYYVLPISHPIHYHRSRVTIQLISGGNRGNVKQGNYEEDVSCLLGPPCPHPHATAPREHAHASAGLHALSK